MGKSSVIGMTEVASWVLPWGHLNFAYFRIYFALYGYAWGKKCVHGGIYRGGTSRGGIGYPWNLSGHSECHPWNSALFVLWNTFQTHIAVAASVRRIRSKLKCGPNSGAMTSVPPSPCRTLPASTPSPPPQHRTIRPGGTLSLRLDTPWPANI